MNNQRCQFAWSNYRKGTNNYCMETFYKNKNLSDSRDSPQIQYFCRQLGFGSNHPLTASQHQNPFRMTYLQHSDPGYSGSSRTTAAAATCTLVLSRWLHHRVGLPVYASSGISSFLDARLGLSGSGCCVTLLVLYRHVSALLSATQTHFCRPAAWLANSHGKVKIHPALRRHVQTELKHCQRPVHERINKHDRGGVRLITIQ